MSRQRLQSTCQLEFDVILLATLWLTEKKQKTEIVKQPQAAKRKIYIRTTLSTSDCSLFRIELQSEIKTDRMAAAGNFI